MLIAADTNVLLDLALETEDITDALETERFADHGGIRATGCGILLSADGHLRGMDYQRLKLLLQDFHVAAPLIATPREIVRKFFR